MALKMKTFWNKAKQKVIGNQKPLWLDKKYA